MSRWSGFLQLSIKRKILFLIAYIMCGITRGAILIIPFKHLKKTMGTYNTESPEEVSRQDFAKVQVIAQVVQQAADCTPWESKCLVKALVVQKLLAMYSIPSTLYLGASPFRNEKMEAHAWLRCGKWIITGASEKENFVQVAKFSK